MGEALCRLLSLPQRAESGIPLALECGRREAVGRIDVLVAATSQGGGEAGVTDLLLMVGCKPLALTLTLRQHLVYGFKLCGRYGGEKGLHHEGLNRGPIEMGTARFGEGPPHTRTDVARTATIGDVHAVSTETTRDKPLQ